MSANLDVADTTTAWRISFNRHLNVSKYDMYNNMEFPDDGRLGSVGVIKSGINPEICKDGKR